MEYLGEGLSKLTDLKSLHFVLGENTIGVNSPNCLNFLKVAIKEMKNLESLYINLYRTFLFTNPKIDLSPLLDSYSQLNFLKYLNLNLLGNAIG